MNDSVTKAHRWQSKDDRKKAFRKAIDADKDGRIFNDEFIERLAERHDKIKAAMQRTEVVPLGGTEWRLG
jgi:hypothetical protein